MDKPNGYLVKGTMYPAETVRCEQAMFERIAELEAESAKLERQLERKTIAKACLSIMYENVRDENRGLLEENQDLRLQLVTALVPDGYKDGE